MTVIPHVIDATASLADAERRIRELAIGQLAVVEGGQLQAVLSVQDVDLARALGVDLGAVEVRRLVSLAVPRVHADAPLATALRAMSAAPSNCVLVVEGAEVRGVLTQQAALQAAASTLEQQGTAKADWSDPSECSVLGEAYLLACAEESAQRLSRDPTGRAEAEVLRRLLEELRGVRASQLEAERRELARTHGEQLPLHQKHLEELTAQHASHTQALGAVLSEIERGAPAATVAEHALGVLASLRAYVERDREPLCFVS